MTSYDVIIVGKGTVGATLALALAKNSLLKIAVLDKNSAALSSQRVSAISLASKQFFQSINVWDKIDVSPFSKMFVWDAKTHGKINFDCQDVQQTALGYIVSDEALRSALFCKMKEYKNIDIVDSVELKKLQKNAENVELIAEHDHFSAALVIGADGANSWVRHQSEFAVHEKDYDHTAIVATVKTESSHQKTAWQCFLPKGPLAFLPLQNENESSIVWSTHPDHARELLALNDDDFASQLSEIFSGKLGVILSTSERLHFPLKMRHAKNYIQPRIALIGDAAHTVHPLAGQGVNLGIKDAICLSQTVHQAIEKNRDIGSFATLRKYEREQKFTNTVMMKSIDGLKSLFANESQWVKSTRSMGLNFTDRASFLKNFLTNYALGL